MTGRRAVAVSAGIYAGLAALMGVRVLGSLGSRIAHEPGDPLLTAAILAWNATHIPGTEEWWQFPIFYPTRDALAFTDHLLGISVLATPVYWLTGNVLTTYNITLLLTFPLCALSMYALAERLTGSAPAAFLAGLAFAFAPYRVAQLPHIQMLTMCWAPLALLGLHLYLDTRRRGWLALFGVCWMLQSAVSGYFLVYFSALVGFWILWFLVARRRWRDVVSVAVALSIAALPLVPILYRYVIVHGRHGFSRQFGEVGVFSADVAAVLCAPTGLTAWGWLKVGCGPEGELFAGAALMVLLCVGVLTWRRSYPDGPALREPRVKEITRRALLALGVAFIAVAAMTLVSGPWRLELGPLHASSTAAVKPLSTALPLLLVAGLLSPAFARMVRRSSTRTFYVLAAIGAWVLSWGPTPTLLGTQVLYMAPYAWFMKLPGVTSLRVPARLWTIVFMCLAIVMSVQLAEYLKRRSRRARAGILAVASCALVMDGWTVIPVNDTPVPAPNPAVLRGATTIELPIGDLWRDIAAEYRAVIGGWRTANGFSGYEPAGYDELRAASAEESPAVFAPFLPLGDLHVLVREDAMGFRRLVELQAGAELTGRADGLLQYRLPRRGTTADEPH